MVDFKKLLAELETRSDEDSISENSKQSSTRGENKEMSQTIEERMKEASEDMSKAQTFIPYGRFNDGENRLEIDTTAKLEKSKFGRTTYTGTLNGERVKVSLPKSVEMQILISLKKGKKAFTVIKTGADLKTRYTVK